MRMDATGMMLNSADVMPKDFLQPCVGGKGSFPSEAAAVGGGITGNATSARAWLKRDTARLKLSREYFSNCYKNGSNHVHSCIRAWWSALNPFHLNKHMAPLTTHCFHRSSRLTFLDTDALSRSMIFKTLRILVICYWIWPALEIWGITKQHHRRSTNIPRLRPRCLRSSCWWRRWQRQPCRVTAAILAASTSE